MLDALVVGAGPVGLTLAAELARFGLSTRIIDKAGQPTTTSKALAIWSRTLELFDRMGCTAEFLAAGKQCHGASIRKGESVLGHVRLESIPSTYNFALIVPQRDTERLMAAQLARHGLAVERPVELARFDDRGDHVVATLGHADGRAEEVSAAWLIGCDGPHSTTRHALNLAFKGEPEPNDWVLADVTLDGPKAPPADEVTGFLHRDGVLVVFPMSGPRFRVVASQGRSDAAHPPMEPTLAEVQRLIDERTGGGFTAGDPQWLSNFRVQERKVDHYRSGRVFLAGDAAHIHSPAGGQGMNTGMQDAIGLAWRLAMVQTGRAGHALLESYSPERNAVGQMVLRNAARMTELVTLANPAAQAIRNQLLHFALGLASVQSHMALQMSEIEIAYKDSPLAAGTRLGALAPGARLPPEDYAGPPPGAGAGTVPRFILMASDRDKAAALLTRFPDLLEPDLRRPPQAGALLIIRPDGYIGFAGKGDALADAAAYLAGLEP